MTNKPPRRRSLANHPSIVDGQRVCRFCRKSIEHRHYLATFCGKDCVHEWKVRSSPSYARRCVFERDGGVCAGCGTPVEKWHADHIVPVAEGGGDCGLDNFRTLCVPCHNQETAALRQRLAAKEANRG